MFRGVLACAVALAMSVLSLGCASKCGPSNCSTCCDATGACVPATAEHCGQAGASCSACPSTQLCVAGVCAFPNSSGGNGAGSNGSGSTSGTAGSSGTTATTAGTASNSTGSAGSTGSSCDCALLHCTDIGEFCNPVVCDCESTPPTSASSSSGTSGSSTTAGPSGSSGSGTTTGNPTTGGTTGVSAGTTTGTSAGTSAGTTGTTSTSSGTGGSCPGTGSFTLSSHGPNSFTSYDVPKGCTPTIDGVPHDDEWQDALSFDVTTSDGAFMTIWLKYGPTSIYALTKIWFTSSGTSKFYVDPGGTGSMTDEYYAAFYDSTCNANGPAYYEAWFSGGYNTISPTYTVNAQCSGSEFAYEWEIPFAAYGITGGQAHTFRLAYDNTNNTEAHWPPNVSESTNGTLDDASLWGDFYSSSNWQ